MVNPFNFNPVSFISGLFGGGNQQQEPTFTPSPQLPTPPEEPEVLTSEERRNIAEGLDPNKSFTVDKFGNVTENTREQQQRRSMEGTKRALGVKTDSQILAERAQKEQIRQAFQKASESALTPEQLEEVGGAPIDFEQAAGAGLVAVGPGAATGAVLGGIGGAGVGALPGAALGAVGGFVTAGLANIRGQTSGEFAADKEALTKGITAMNSLITDVNQNPQNAAQDIELFQQVLNNIDVAHAKTKRDSDEDLNRWLGKDGTRELSRFENFDSTLRQVYINRFYAAIQSPDPNAIAFSVDELEQIQGIVGDE